MASILSVLTMDKFKNDPRCEVFNKILGTATDNETEQIFELISDIVQEVVKTDKYIYARQQCELQKQECYNNAELKEEEHGDEQICYMTNDFGIPFVLNKESIINCKNVCDNE